MENLYDYLNEIWHQWNRVDEKTIHVFCPVGDFFELEERVMAIKGAVVLSKKFDRISGKESVIIKHK